MSGDLVARLRNGEPCFGDECRMKDAASCLCTEAADEIERLRKALEEIRAIVHTPTKNTAFRRAEDHYASDFDRIRKIIAQAICNLR